MPEETVTSILVNGSMDEYHGYGIKNINERIVLHYGGSYGLSFESTLNSGTKVFIRIPAKIAANLPVLGR